MPAHTETGVREFVQELVVLPMIPESDWDNSMNVPSDLTVVVFFISFFLIGA